MSWHFLEEFCIIYIVYLFVECQGLYIFRLINKLCKIITVICIIIFLKFYHIIHWYFQNRLSPIKNIGQLPTQSLPCTCSLIPLTFPRIILVWLPFSIKTYTTYSKYLNHLNLFLIKCCLLMFDSTLMFLAYLLSLIPSSFKCYREKEFRKASFSNGRPAFKITCVYSFFKIYS